MAPILADCWARVSDGGTTFNQHWVLPRVSFTRQKNSKDNSAVYGVLNGAGPVIFPKNKYTFNAILAMSIKIRSQNF